MVGGPHVGVEEELAGVGEGPVFGNGVFGFAGLGGFDEFLEGAVFADEFEGGRGADLGDGVEVVTAQEDAEVDELVSG